MTKRPPIGKGTSPASGARQGVLMVMMENYAIKSANFLPSGKIAIGIKMTKAGMNIVRHIDDIGHSLSYTGKRGTTSLCRVPAT